ncbi:MAG: zinc ribbon domain-containing protein [Mediterraneibacter faecis]
MLECGYCGHKLSRRTRHQTTTTKKPVWQCMNAIKNGIDSCPNCKEVDEVIIENAFLEAFRLLADNFDDVLQSVLNTIEDILKDDTELKRVKQLEKDISSIESKKAG